MSEYQNRSIVLARRPIGEVRDEDFRTENETVRDLRPGEFLIQILYLSLDPYMRPKMNDVESYMPPMELDAVVQGENIGRIVESRSEKFAVGELVTSYTGWQQYAIVSDETPMLHKVNPAGLPISVFLGPAGMPGRTGYMGLTRVGDPKPGETVVVSAASGAVGSVVGGGGSLMFYWGWNGLQERRKAIMHRVQRKILRLATAKGGTLTVTEVAADLNLSLSAAEKLLTGMDDGFRVRSEISAEGVIYYEFPELLHRKSLGSGGSPVT